jgi:hypothetical protein
MPSLDSCAGASVARHPSARAPAQSGCGLAVVYGKASAEPTSQYCTWFDTAGAAHLSHWLPALAALYSGAGCSECRPCLSLSVVGFEPPLPGGGLIFNRAPALPRRALCLFRPLPGVPGGSVIGEISHKKRQVVCAATGLNLESEGGEKLKLGGKKKEDSTSHFESVVEIVDHSRPFGSNPLKNVLRPCFDPKPSSSYNKQHTEQHSNKPNTHSKQVTQAHYNKQCSYFSP